MRLGRPVKWTEDRAEHFVAVNHERGQLHDVEVGYDDDGHVLALDVDFVHDAGAYTPYGIILPIITAAQLPGPYRIPNYRVRFRDLYANATPTSPYRGAGRPQARCATPSAGGQSRRRSSRHAHARGRRSPTETSRGSRRPASSARPARPGRRAATRRTCEWTRRPSGWRSSGTWSSTTAGG